MQLLLQFFLLILGFVLLIKGADVFVDGSSGVARRFGISELVVGLTIVAMGTSLPEAAISISASLKGSEGIAIGNVLGSNILNVLLILGLTAIICPICVERSVPRREIPFLVAISVLLPLLGLIDGELSRIDGIILLAAFAAYLFWLFKKSKSQPDETSGADEALLPLWKSILFIVLGAALVVIGSNLTIDSASKIAKAFGMNDRLIGLTIIAIGTSLPELVTGIVAALKGSTDMALGNIVGSNLFNIMFVLGSAALIAPVAYPAAFLADSLIGIGVALLLWALLIRDSKLQRKEGAIMLVCFAAYYTWLFISQ